jgi:hypothetical protein
MANSKQKYHRKSTGPFPWMPVLLGLTLIGIAIVALATLRSKSEAADLSSVVLVEAHFAAPELSLQNLEGKTGK